MNWKGLICRILGEHRTPSDPDVRWTTCLRCGKPIDADAEREFREQRAIW